MLQIISEYIWPKLKIILIVVGVVVAIYFYVNFRKDSWEKYSTKLNYKKDLIEQIMAKLNDVSKDKNILGYDDAKINIIEYVNVTCPYSSRFHKQNYKRIVKDFVKTHKAKYVIRVALASDQSRIMSRIFNCIQNSELAYAFLNNCMLYRNNWIHLNGEKQKEALLKIAKFVNISDNEFYACYNNTALDGILKSKEMEEMKYFSYVSTPMVIINQDILSGNIEYTKLEKLANKAYRKAK